MREVGHLIAGAKWTVKEKILKSFAEAARNDSVWILFDEGMAARVVKFIQPGRPLRLAYVITPLDDRTLYFPLMRQYLNSYYRRNMLILVGEVFVVFVMNE